MKSKAVLRRYYVLPCCLLLLNLVNTIVSYKAGLIADAFVRTLLVMSLVLFGSGLVAYAVSPGIEWLISDLHKQSKKRAGGLGEAAFLVGLGIVVFWLYYRVQSHGAEGILPRGVWNPRHGG